MKRSKSLFAGAVMLLACMVISLFPAATANAADFFETDEQIAADIAWYPITMTIDGNTQTFSISAGDIDSIKVKSKRYNPGHSKVTVKSVIDIDRDFVDIRANVTSVYKYRNKEWKLSSVKYTKAVISDIDLEGTWSGKYTVKKVSARAEIEVYDQTITGKSSGYISDAMMYFSALPSNPRVPSGSYSMTGKYDLAAGTVDFIKHDWTEKPDSTWKMLSFNTYIDMENMRLIGKNNKLILEKID